MSDESQEKPVEEGAPVEVAPVSEEVVDVKKDQPLTSDEIRDAANDLYNHAKDAWVKPVRKEIRGWFRASKEFLDGLGEDRKKDS